MVKFKVNKLFKNHTNNVNQIDNGVRLTSYLRKLVTHKIMKNDIDLHRFLEESSLKSLAFPVGDLHPIILQFKNRLLTATDLAPFTEVNDWFANRKSYQDLVVDQIKNLLEISKKMKEERAALNETSLSFKYFIENVSIDQNKNIEFVNFQEEITRMNQKQEESDTLLLWFTEDCFAYLTAADNSLRARRLKMRELEKLMKSSVYGPEIESRQDEIDNFTKMLRSELEEFDSCLRKRLRDTLRIYQVQNKCCLKRLQISLSKE